MTSCARHDVNLEGSPSHDAADPMSANLAGLLDAAAAAHPRRPALVHDGTSLDYRALHESALRFAGLLRTHGVAPGDRVAILLPNRPAFVAAYYGALRLGAVVVPLNALSRGPEIEQRLED